MVAVLAALYVIPVLPFVPRSEADLKFSVIDAVGQPLVCTGWGMPNPIFSPYEHYPQIVADLPTYQSILRRLRLLPTPLTNDQIVAVYREWLKLNVVRLTWQGGTYEFDMTPGPNGPSDWGHSEMLGQVDIYGHVYNVHQGAGIGTCPICLPGATPISTPRGDVPVAAIRVGMSVWTAGADGGRVDAVVLETRSRTDAPGSELIHIVLSDGRQLSASPPHEIAGGRRLDSLRVGDLVGGVEVTRLDAVPDALGWTYDLLPSGPTGEYWAAGILLRSTLSPG